MMSDYVRVELRLEVIAGDKVLVPGHEPISELTSRTLAFQWGSRPALADLQVLLDAIPGSRVEFGSNWGGTQSGVRKKWFVLPAHDQTCPCTARPDHYETIRRLASEEPVVQDRYDHCDVVGMGYSPSPDWDQEPPPPPSPYREAGTTPSGGTGVLPPVPPWVYRY